LYIPESGLFIDLTLRVVVADVDVASCFKGEIPRMKQFGGSFCKRRHIVFYTSFKGHVRIIII